MFKYNKGVCAFESNVKFIEKFTWTIENYEPGEFDAFSIQGNVHVRKKT
jgi:hypothetical protein